MTTNQPASGTDTLRPVSDNENREVKGAARVNKSAFDGVTRRTEELRLQQQAYEASLPKDPMTAMAEIARNIPDLADYSAAHYAPRAALEIIKELSMNGGLDDSEAMNGAVYWLATQGLFALTEIDRKTDHARAIAWQFNPKHRPFTA